MLSFCVAEPPFERAVPMICEPVLRSVELTGRRVDLIIRPAELTVRPAELVGRPVELMSDLPDGLPARSQPHTRYLSTLR